MKTERLIISKLFLRLLVLSLACLPIAAQSATTITGLLEFSTDLNGSFFNGSVWNTKGGDSASDLWVVQGSSPAGSFLNGPTDANAGISIPLAPGSYTFSLLAAGGVPNSYHGLNLFFNGANSSPGISVFGPTQTSASPPYPGFNPNGSSSTLTLSYQPVIGANTLLFEDSANRVTLVGYQWADPSVYGVDRVSAPFGNPGFVGSDGQADWVGQLSFEVTSVPEPSAFALIATAVGFLAVRALRRLR